MRYVDPTGNYIETESDNPDLKKITITRGDILSQISIEMYGTKKFVDLIALVNNIQDPDKIFVGQQLIIPVMTLQIPDGSKQSNAGIFDLNLYIAQNITLNKEGLLVSLGKETAITGFKKTLGFTMEKVGKEIAKPLKSSKYIISGFDDVAGDIIEKVPLEKTAGVAGKVVKSAGFWIDAWDLGKNEFAIICDPDLNVLQKLHKGTFELGIAVVDVVVGGVLVTGGTAIGGPLGTVGGIAASTGMSMGLSRGKQWYYEKMNLD